MEWLICDAFDKSTFPKTKAAQSNKFDGIFIVPQSLVLPVWDNMFLYSPVSNTGSAYLEYLMLLKNDQNNKK